MLKWAFIIRNVHNTKHLSSQLDW